jgi:hydroxymethylglutaryl-CoA lyase
MPTPLDIREVGPRDGLQGERPIPVAERVRLLEALLDAGLRHVEACSFVSPKAVPAMADAADVLRALGPRPGVRLAALVPNRRGAELALATGLVEELTVTVSVSAAYNEKNVRMTVDESLAGIAGICGLAAADDIAVDVILSCAFGSPFAGETITAIDVATAAASSLDAGATQITLADTTGEATPSRVQDVLAAMPVPPRQIGLHLHDTRGSALVNAWAGLEAGVRRFDTAVGGLGGSPFAPGAGGNLATEDLVNVLDGETGIDLARLVAAAHLAAELVGHAVPSRVAAAGPRR